MPFVRVAAAQTPEIRESLDEALDCLADFACRAEAAGASLLCFPEGFLQGYLLDDETARRYALDLASPAFAAVLDRFPKTGPSLVVGLIEVEGGRRLYNTAVVVERGVLIGRYRKTHLLRGEALFTAGTQSPVFEVGGLRFGINICYDTNFPEAARKVADGGAHIIVCPANKRTGWGWGVDTAKKVHPCRRSRVSLTNVTTNDSAHRRDARGVHGHQRPHVDRQREVNREKLPAFFGRIDTPHPPEGRRTQRSHSEA
ncbi:MAG: hypothetical protein RLZZ450_3701 [Pseudomonadota bacterium]|jgi:predicted amidohydrolase